MGTTRTSNKDILNAIEGQTAAITALAAAISGSVIPAKASVPVVETAAPAKAGTSGKPQVDEPYLNHMVAKVTEKCAEDGESRVLYARRNGHGETKLAYCLLSRWASLRDGGLIGAVKQIDPS